MGRGGSFVVGVIFFLLGLHGHPNRVVACLQLPCENQVNFLTSCKTTTMNITLFIQTFPSEESCRIHLKQHREEHGITCKKCQSTEHFWIQSKWQWQCRKCLFRTTLKSGTAMENSKLPIRKWYLCIGLMSSIKKGVSAKEMQRQLNHTRYRTIWELMHRIRKSIGRQESALRMQIEQLLTLENAWMLKKINCPNHLLSFELKRNHKTCIPGDQPGEFLVKHEFVPGGAKGIRALNNFYTPISIARNKSGFQKQKWFSILKSNMNRLIIGIHHRVSIAFLQNYLDDFCFRLNHRKDGHDIFLSYMHAIISQPLLYTSDHS